MHWASLVGAVVVGFLLWSFTGALCIGTPFGAPELRDAFVFFAPIVGVAIPFAFRNLIRGRYSRSAWFLALAPLLGLGNFLLVVLVATGIEGSRTPPTSSAQGGLVAGSAEAARAAEASASAVLYTSIFWVSLLCVMVLSALMQPEEEVLVGRSTIALRITAGGYGPDDAAQ